MRLYLVATKHEMYAVGRARPWPDEYGDWLWTHDEDDMEFAAHEIHRAYSGHIRLPKPGEVVVLDVTVKVVRT